MLRKTLILAAVALGLAAFSNPAQACNECVKQAQAVAAAQGTVVPQQQVLLLQQQPVVAVAAGVPVCAAACQRQGLLAKMQANKQSRRAARQARRHGGSAVAVQAQVVGVVGQQQAIAAPQAAGFELVPQTSGVTVRAGNTFVSVGGQQYQLVPTTGAEVEADEQPGPADATADEKATAQTAPPTFNPPVPSGPVVNPGSRVSFDLVEIPRAFMYQMQMRQTANAVVSYAAPAIAYMMPAYQAVYSTAPAFAATTFSTGVAAGRRHLLGNRQTTTTKTKTVQRGL